MAIKLSAELFCEINVNEGYNNKYSKAKVLSEILPNFLKTRMQTEQK
jgi:hypothetical protein